MKHEETDACDIFRADKVVNSLSFNHQHGIYMTNRDFVFLRRVIYLNVSCKKHDSMRALYRYSYKHYRYYRATRYSDKL